MEVTKLPTGWRLAQLGDIVKIGSRNVDPSLEPERLWNYVALENVEQRTGRLVEFVATPGKEIGSTKARFQRGDVVYGKLRPYLRKAWVAEFDGCSSTDLIPLTPGDGVLAEYLKWFLLSPLHMEYIMPLMAGIRMPRLRSDDLYNMPIPLPSITEQRRVVTRVEEMMERSRRARGALETAEQRSSDLKQSLLTAAMYGDLTTHWRVQNPNTEPASSLLKRIATEGASQSENNRLGGRKTLGKRGGNAAAQLVEFGDLPMLPKGWCWGRIEQVATYRSGTPFESKIFRSSGVQVLRLGNLYKGKLDLSRDPVYVESSLVDDSVILHPGTLVVSQTGTRNKRDYGHFEVIPENAPRLVANQRLLVVIPSPLVPSEWIQLATKLGPYRDHFFSQETGGVNQGNVGVAGVMGGPIPIAPLAEMRTIVQLLKQQLERVTSFEDKARRSSEELAILDQTILTHAFSGRFSKV